MLATHVKRCSKDIVLRGTQKGERRGERNGVAKTLTQPLQHRFGLSPEWASEHIAKVNPDELEMWRLQVLEAPTLEEVFVH